MRTADARVNPGVYDFFGGGLDEGESPEAALIRELGEELEYIPTNYVYFSRYENATHINNLFIEEVGADFEASLKIHEGQYGRFLTIDEVIASGTVFTQARFILEQVSTYLSKN